MSAWLALALALLGAFAAPATVVAALAPLPPAAPAGSAAPKEAPLLDWSHAKEVYHLVEAWAHDGAVPDAAAPVPAIWVSDASGIRVTLRTGGATMGRGDAHAPGKVVDLAVLARTATAVALEDVKQGLQDSYRRAVVAKTPAQPQKAKTVDDVRALLVVDVQVAHAPQAIALRADADRDAVYTKFAPGYHGLVLADRRGDGKRYESWTWPASALGANIGPQSQLVEMLEELGHQVKDLPKVARPGGPELARFEVIHLVRPGADSVITQLVRGNVLLPEGPISGRTLDSMAQRLAGHLVHRQRPDGALAGTYLPSADRYDPATASSQEVALTTYALGQRARLLLAQDPKSEEAATLMEASRRSATWLTQQTIAAKPPLTDPATNALLVLAIAESPHLADRKIERDALVKRLLGLRQADGSFRSDVQPAPPPAGAAASAGGNPPTTAPGPILVNLPTHALILHALAAVYEQTRDLALGRAVTDSRDWIWNHANASGLVSALPWLALVEYRLHRLNMNDADEGWAKRAANLAAVAKALRDAQIQAPVQAGPPDVVGGYTVVKLPPDTPPNPDWRSAQMLAFLAATLRERDMVRADQKLDWLLECGLGARFLAQLMFDEPACFYVRSKDDALGGVRPALWDNRLSAAPTAMALLAVTQLQQTIAALGDAGVQRDGAADPVAAK